ncbi:MAG: hypothetical protein GF320_14845 [Armatimonadia bacterium]|nr:hypothetical protein [Armatimonadia bacterium]
MPALLLAQLVISGAVCLLASCAGSPGLPYDVQPLGTGLTVVPAEGAASPPSLEVLAERTADYRGEDRTLIYGVSGRFAEIVNSSGQRIAGPGIAAIIYADAGRDRVLRVVLFEDPGPDSPTPTLTAKAIEEDLFELEDDELPRPPRVIVTVAGLHAGVDAGPAGTIEGDVFTGGVVFMDLEGPGPINVVAFQGEASDSPLDFEEVTADSKGTRATVNAAGHVVSTSDLLGLSRVAEGRALRLQLGLYAGTVEELSLAPAPAPSE